MPKQQLNIKEERERKNLSQQELSDMTGIPKPRIAKWEQGKGSPKLDDSNKLEEFFKDKLLQSGKDIVEEVPSRLTLDSLSGLVESNKVLSESNKMMAHSNQILIENNNRLMTLLQPTVDVAREIQTEISPLLFGIQDFLLELAAGKKYKTIQEAGEALNNRLTAKVRTLNETRKTFGGKGNT